MPHHDHSSSTVSGTARIEAYSDAVIAIVITILVLELHVPTLADTSVLGVLISLRQIAPQLLSFAFSFLTLSVFWVNHHHFYHELNRSDGRLLWFNNILLFWLALIPFTTAFLGQHPLLPGVIMIYCFVLFMAACSFMLMSHHAMFVGNLLHVDIPLEQRKEAFQRSYVGVICYGLATVIAPFFALFSGLIMIFIPVFYIAPRLMHEHDDDEE